MFDHRTVRIGFVIGIMACGQIVRPLRADEPPKLSYGFQNGREYTYHVKMVADLPEAEQNSEGDYTCKIQDATDSQFTLQASGGLADKVSTKRPTVRRSAVGCVLRPTASIRGLWPAGHG